jgi:hypothetical protein
VTLPVATLGADKLPGTLGGDAATPPLLLLLLLPLLLLLLLLLLPLLLLPLLLLPFAAMALFPPPLLLPPPQATTSRSGSSALRLRVERVSRAVECRSVNSRRINRKSILPHPLLTCVGTAEREFS